MKSYPLSNDEVRKAPGIDQISSEVIRFGAQPMAEMLYKIFLKTWDTEKPPKDWSKMLVSPIFKKGDRLSPANYYIVTFNPWEDIQPNSSRQNENANRKTPQRKPVWIPTGTRHRRCDLCHKTNPRKSQRM